MSEFSLYWKSKLKGPLATLDLPLDFKRPLMVSHEAGAFSFSLSVDKSHSLRDLAFNSKTSLSHIFLLAYKITLARFSGLDDIIVGSDLNGRVQVLRTFINLSESFDENLKSINTTVDEAFKHSETSFETILQLIDYIRDERRTPLFQAYYSFINSSTADKASTTKTDLDLIIAAGDEGAISGHFIYRKDLFKELSIERFAECFFFLLEQVIADSKSALKSIPATPPAHQELILSSWNNSWSAKDKLLPFHKLFEEQARLFPDSIAVENNQGAITFNELNIAANRCANALLEKGVGRGDLIGISLSRDFNLLISILGVLKTGAGYVPLDPAFPQERLDYMIESAKPKILITEESLAGRFSREEKLFIAAVASNSHFDLPLPEVEHQLSDTIYVIYTSGSTGKPKGVQLTHGSVTNFLLSMKDTIGFDKKDKILAVTTLSFDIAVLELCLPLISGGTVYLATTPQAMDGVALKNILESKDISVMQATPTTWRLMLAAGWKGDSHLKILCGGEAFPPDLAQTLIPICQDVWNMYGPTETTVWSLCKKLKLNDEFITIGKPIANTSVYILDDNHLMKPIGSSGELFIGGHGLALGYFGREDLTAERFVADPFIPGAKMYATGDLARFTHEGEVECLGRNDGQVKVRGFRIELGEIEQALARQDKVSQAVVKIIDDEMGNFICAYYLGSADAGALRDNLRLSLPEYMVPSTIVKLDSIPMTLNGKIDYKSLPVPEHSRPDLLVEFVAAETPSQQLVEKYWKKFIRIQNIGIDDNFFDLGGTSLVAIKIMVEINQVSPKKLTVVDLFQYGTIRQIANFIDTQKDELDNFIQKQNSEGEILSGDIAVISMTGRFPGAKNVDEFWDNLLAIKNTIDIFKPEDINPAVPAELAQDSHYVLAEGSYPGQENFDYKFFGMTPRESELVDPQQRKFLELSHEVLELAGYNPDTYSGSIGIFAGMGNSKYGRLVDQYPEKTKLFGDFNITLGLEKDYLATKIAFKLNLKGPALSIYTACSTSLVAIIEAVKNLRLKNCDMALAGGISISGAPNTGHLYQEGGIFSKNGECRAFDQHATGTVFTDGAGAVILKRLSDAERDGDNILAVIKGIGVNNDGANKISFTAPSVIGQAEAILRAQKDAGISADTLGFLEAHGTATPVGDPIEVEALTKAFSKSTDKKNFCYLSSVKTNIGHLTCAAGVASFIKAVKVVETGIIPGTVHYTGANTLLELDKTPFIITNETQPFPDGHELRRAGISSFGVGGTNAHVIIEEYKKPKAEIKNDQKATDYSLFKLSAKSEKQLQLMQADLLAFLEKTQPDQWRKVAYTLELGRKEYKYRSFVIGKTQQDLDRLTNFNSGKGQFTKQPSVYFMFPGQGSHYKQMGKGLYEISGIFRDIFNQCCDLIGKHISYNIKDIIFDESSDENLNNTFYSQPAIFIIEYSLAMTLKSMGINPKACIGHSIGEFVAATINGVFSLEDGLRAIAKRAEIMKALPEGMMLSVSMPEKELRALIENRALDIAAVNGRLSCVVAGSKSDVLAFKDELANIDIASIELKTSHAFHSRMMKPAVETFLKFLKPLNISTPKEVMYSTVTTNLESDLFGTPEYWANHIVDAVQFSQTVAKILKTSNILFLEVGTKNILSNLVKKEMQNIDGADSKIIALLGSKSDLEDMSFNKALGDLWISGIKVSDPGILFAVQDRQRVIAPVYIFEENKIWLEYKNKKITKKTFLTTEDIMDARLTALQTKLIELFERSSGIDVGTFDHDTTFLEMGMDSLFLSQLSLAVKKEMKVNVTFRQLMEDFSTINLLSNHLLDKVELGAPKVSAPIMMNTAKAEAPMPQASQLAVKIEQPVAQPMVQVPPQIQAQPQMHTQIMPTRTVAPVMSSGLESIINRQLELMSQQIMLLNGSQISTTLSPVNVAPGPQIQIPAAMSAASQVSLPVEKKEVVDQAPLKKGKVSVTNVKEAFGAQARITAEKSNQLTAQQLNQIQKFVEKYNAKTKSSKKFTQDNRKNHSDPRAVTGFKPETKEVVYPIVVKKSYLQALWDLDDNQYIDMTCGFGSNFFGNGNETIKKHVINQINEGIEIGPQHPLVADVSNMINEMTGSERVAFCSTGSESVLGAMRIARTVTGREKIIVFSGSYHGINDEVILRGSKSGNSYPAAPGINSQSVSNMIVLDYGTAESLQIIREMASEVAAVLIEPVQSRRCDFHPVEFLKEVRKITLESNTCLIFDEIITGFRVHLAGAQGYFGIKADLCTYGKIIGGGVPIGVIAGKAEYMDALDGGHWQYGDDSTPTVGVTYFAGTFCRHPLALASAKGALEVLKAGGAERLDKLNKRAQKFADDLNLFLLTEGAPIKMDNFGSLMKPKWTADVASGDLLFAILRYNGVHVYDGFPWFVNLAHTEQDLVNVLDAFKSAVKTMQGLGLFPSKNQTNELEVTLDPNVFDQKGAPMVGAKLGRDEKGNPAWFVEDPDNAGEYYLLKG